MKKLLVLFLIATLLFISACADLLEDEDVQLMGTEDVVEKNGEFEIGELEPISTRDDDFFADSFYLQLASYLMITMDELYEVNILLPLVDVNKGSNAHPAVVTPLDLLLLQASDTVEEFSEHRAMVEEMLSGRGGVDAVMDFLAELGIELVE